jgi:serine protease Do
LCAILLLGAATHGFAKTQPVAKLAPLASLERDASLVSLPAGGSFAPVVEKAAPAVVSITTSAVIKASGQELEGFPFFFGQPQEPADRKRRGAGSGVIVNENGYILTNHHVIDGAQEIEVALGDKRTFRATVVGSDEKTDIAVLKIEGDALPVLPFGNSDAVRAGDIVLAIGNPFGIGKTVTMGIVGATGRGNLGIEDYEDFIQTDAAINPGNSGGALVNTRGELVGINTAILSRSGGNQGVGFAVPVNMAHHVMSQILEHGSVQRGYLGVAIQDLTPAMAKAFGVDARGGAVVGEVTGDGPAAAAGVERGDVIVGLNGRPVEDARQFRLDVAAAGPGTEVRLDILRNGTAKQVPVRLGKFPGASAPREEAPVETRSSFGLSLQDLTPEIARELDLPPGSRGAVVVGVQPGSAAAEAGVRRGDVIQEVNRSAVTGAEDFRQALSRGAGGPLLLLVNRGGRTSYVVLESR